MEDLGPPIAYLALEDGVPVYASGGEEIGTVAHVLADEEADVFDGLVIDVRPGHRFADAAQVDEMYERGVVLTLERAAAERLPEPSENPAVVDADPADTDESEVTAKLRRAWDWISGRY
jgi:uncharacterized protein YrrD